MTKERTHRNPAWWFAVAFGVIVAVALAVPGMARAGTISDPNDVHGKLDIASVTQEHAAIGPVVHTITTYGPWRSRVLGGQHYSYFVIEIDTAGNARPERYALVYRDHGVLRVAVVTRRGRLLGFGTAIRPNLRSVRVSIPRKLLGKPGGYRWKLFSVYVAPGDMPDRVRRPGAEQRPGAPRHHCSDGELPGTGPAGLDDGGCSFRRLRQGPLRPGQLDAAGPQRRRHHVDRHGQWLDQRQPDRVGKRGGG